MDRVGVLRIDRQLPRRSDPARRWAARSDRRRSSDRRRRRRRRRRDRWRPGRARIVRPLKPRAAVRAPDSSTTSNPSLVPIKMSTVVVLECPDYTPHARRRRPAARDTPRPRGDRASTSPGAPLGQVLAEVEHVEPVGEVGHHLHVVLDPDHRQPELVLDPQDVAREVLALVAVEAGRGLVEQQHARLQRQRPREADHLLHAERQRADRLVAVALELDELEDLLHDAGGARPRPRARRERTAPRRGDWWRPGRGAPTRRFSSTRHVRRTARRAGRCAPGRAARSRAAGCAVDVAALEHDAAAAGPVDPADAVEDAGLAGAVGPDQGQQLAGARPRTTRPRARCSPPKASDSRSTLSAALSHTSAGCGGTA